LETKFQKDVLKYLDLFMLCQFRLLQGQFLCNLQACLTEQLPMLLTDANCY
jgi:hypothetical protein